MFVQNNPKSKCLFSVNGIQSLNFLIKNYENDIKEFRGGKKKKKENLIQNSNTERKSNKFNRNKLESNKLKFKSLSPLKIPFIDINKSRDSCNRCCVECLRNSETIQTLIKDKEQLLFELKETKRELQNMTKNYEILQGNMNKNKISLTSLPNVHSTNASYFDSSYKSFSDEKHNKLKKENKFNNYFTLPDSKHTFTPTNGINVNTPLNLYKIETPKSLFNLSNSIEFSSAVENLKIILPNENSFDKTENISRNKFINFYNCRDKKDVNELTKKLSLLKTRTKNLINSLLENQKLNKFAS